MPTRYGNSRIPANVHLVRSVRIEHDDVTLTVEHLRGSVRRSAPVAWLRWTKTMTENGVRSSHTWTEQRTGARYATTGAQLDAEVAEVADLNPVITVLVDNTPAASAPESGKAGAQR